MYPHYARVGFLGPFHTGMRAGDEERFVYLNKRASDVQQEVQKNITEPRNTLEERIDSQIGDRHQKLIDGGTSEGWTARNHHMRL